ncbi:MAG TPA: DUF2892 domain-containing protein [Candidatus Nanoarchaeia archaeon]|nr:DUF2892 domain-containing protein [Candidatus Nanoarchaeia archaeon]
MKQNLSMFDRILRFVLAFWFLGPLQPVSQSDLVNWIVLIFGVIALIESFVGYCPCMALLGIKEKK